MKKIFFLCLTPFLYAISIGQNMIPKNTLDQSMKGQNSNDPIKKHRKDFDIQQLCKDLDSLPYIDLSKTPKKNTLVSQYAFWKLIKSNFNALVIGNEDISKIGRYASIDISDDNSFSFSPYVFESSDKDIYRHNFSVNFAGKLNDNKFFNLSDYRDLSISINYNHVLNWTAYKTKNDIDEKELGCKHKIGLSDLCEKYSKKETDNDCFAKELRSKKREELYDAFVNDFIEIESSIAEDYWKSKNFWWYSIDFKFFGRDEVKFLPRALYTLNKYEPTRDAVFTPGIKFSLNYFTLNNSSKNSFVVGGWINIERKHSLSEVMEPEDFQDYHKLNDSLIKLNPKQSVFITDFDKITRKGVIDFGFRTVKMFDFSSEKSRIKFGVSGSFARIGLVNEEKFPSLFRSEVGIVIPFLKSDGESTFNLELFRRWDTYSNFNADNDKFYGIRFNIPISH